MDSSSGEVSYDSGEWINVTPRAASHPASASSSSASLRSDASILSEMDNNAYSSDHPIRAPLPFDEGKSELYDSDDSRVTLDAIRDLPPYLKAQCHLARERHLNVRKMLKEMIDIENRFITETTTLHAKYFPLRVGSLDKETVSFVNAYRKEIPQRVRFHRILNGRMKRQYNRLSDILKGRRGSKTPNSLPPILTCDVCNMCEESDSHKKILTDSQVTVCSNRSCEHYTCMRCAFRIEPPSGKPPCPFCRSPLTCYPSDSGFPVSRDEFRQIQGSLFPEIPVEDSELTSQMIIHVSSSSLIPPTIVSDFHNFNSSDEPVLSDHPPEAASSVSNQDDEEE